MTVLSLFTLRVLLSFLQLYCFTSCGLMLFYNTEKLTLREIKHLFNLFVFWGGGYNSTLAFPSVIIPAVSFCSEGMIASRVATLGWEWGWVGVSLGSCLMPLLATGS